MKRVNKGEPHYFVSQYLDTNITRAKATYNYQTYGTLYNLWAARNACPQGWRLPEQSDVQVLREHAANVGRKLRAINSWELRDGGDDEYGFAALPGGSWKGEHFYDIGINASWWVYNKDYLSFNVNGSSIEIKAEDPEYAISIRCIANMLDLSYHNTPTAVQYGSFTDERDGNIYRTVRIGSRVWLADNMRYLPHLAGEVKGYEFRVYGYHGKVIEEAKATDNYMIYGVLYNLEAAKIACPAGWHLPTLSEWNILSNNVDGDTSAGVKLKHTAGWLRDGNGTDDFGFAALPGGRYDVFSGFSLLNQEGIWWKEPEPTSTNGTYAMSIASDRASLYRASSSPHYNNSVRCVEDYLLATEE